MLAITQPPLSTYQMRPKTIALSTMAHALHAVGNWLCVMHKPSAWTAAIAAHMHTAAARTPTWKTRSRAMLSAAESKI